MVSVVERHRWNLGYGLSPLGNRHRLPIAYLTEDLGK